MTKKPEKKPAEAGKVTKLPASQVAPKTAKAKVATVYAGPNVPGGVLSQFTVFREGVLAPHVKQIVERYPAIKQLIIPVNRLSKVLSNLKDAESAESAQFKAILAQFKKGEQ